MQRHFLFLSSRPFCLQHDGRSFSQRPTENTLPFVSLSISSCSVCSPDLRWNWSQRPADKLVEESLWDGRERRVMKGRNGTLLARVISVYNETSERLSVSLIGHLDGSSRMIFSGTASSHHVCQKTEKKKKSYHINTCSMYFYRLHNIFEVSCQRKHQSAQYQYCKGCLGC